MLISNGEELLRAAEYAGGFFKSTEIWWRGQSKTERSLLPGIFRRSDPFVEQDFTHTFRRKARTRYSNCPQNLVGPEWLFLMQHYGLPTRLLDWSESILIALYFATSENFKVDGALYALSPLELNFRQTDVKGILEPYGELYAAS